MIGNPFLVLDGHDGCGKSTIAALVAERIGGRVVKPFCDSLGDHIAWLWGNQRFTEADVLSRSAVERISDTDDPRPMVFDRHWTTMFTVLPEEYWPNWGDLPPTVVCHAPTEVVRARLGERGEARGDRAEHDYYQNRYRELAALTPRALVLDTGATPLADCVTQVIEFARAVQPSVAPGQRPT